MRKVNAPFWLLGKSKNTKAQLTNQEILDNVKRQVEWQFGSRSLYVADENNLLKENAQYPDYFAAAWLTSKESATGQQSIGSELVIVSHGRDFESAKKGLLKNIANIEWSDVAVDIW